MAIDESKEFKPINIAVLTVSDTRTFENDTSGDILVERIESAGHSLAAREISRDSAEEIAAHLHRWIDDETIEIADNRFDKTRQNLEANPALSVLFWSPESTGCYQVKGRAELIKEGPIYDACVAWVHRRSAKLTPKAAVRLHIEEIYCGAERIA